MMKYIDAHCHYGAPQSEAGVYNATNESDWAAVLSCADVRAIGIHPWYVSRASAGWDTRMRDLLVKNPDVMVGECGLDKLHPDWPTQVLFFTRQLQIAAELGRGIHIHCVRAWNELYKILQGGALPPVIVLHGFTGSPQVAEQFLKIKNVYFSFGRAILDTHRKSLNHTIAVVPIDKILVESDGNAYGVSATIPVMVQHIAEIKSLAPDKCADIIYNNTLRMIQNGQAAQN